MLIATGQSITTQSPQNLPRPGTHDLIKTAAYHTKLSTILPEAHFKQEFLQWSYSQNPVEFCYKIVLYNKHITTYNTEGTPGVHNSHFHDDYMVHFTFSHHKMADFPI